jgi:hypothetical protein
MEVQSSDQNTFRMSKFNRIDHRVLSTTFRPPWRHRTVGRGPPLSNHPSDPVLRLSLLSSRDLSPLPLPNRNHLTDRLVSTSTPVTTRAAWKMGRARMKMKKVFIVNPLKMIALPMIRIKKKSHHNLNHQNYMKVSESPLRFVILTCLLSS